MKTDNELGGTLSEAELDEVRGGGLLDRLQRETLSDNLRTLNADARRPHTVLEHPYQLPLATTDSQDDLQVPLPDLKSWKI